MSELPPHAAALLEAARREHNPSDADRERVHGAVFDALSLPHIPNSSFGEAQNPGLPSPVAPAATSSMSAKVALIAALALGGVGVLSFRVAPGRTAEAHREPSATPSSSSKNSAPVANAEGARPENASEVLAPSTAEPHLRVPAFEAKVEAKVARGVHGARTHRRDVPPPVLRAKAAVPFAGAPVPRGVSTPPAAPASTAAPAPVDDLVAAPVEASPPSALGELVLIRRALSALRAGSPSGALRALAEHRAKYPEGALLSEREGLQVVALCENGQLEAGRRHKAGFLERFASSPIAARIRGACLGDAR